MVPRLWEVALPEAHSGELERARVALVADFLVDFGGAERVLLSMLRIFPKADLYVLHHDPRKLPSTLNARVTGTSAISGWLRRSGLDHRRLAPIFPFLIEQFDFSGYDLIVSSSYFCAKSILKPSTACHVSYCHTPFRQVWDRYHDYCRDMKNPLLRGIFQLFAHYFRLWDVCSARSVDAFFACSNKVAARIEAVYHRPAQVLYPPVALPPAPPTPAPAAEPYFICISRLFNTYKRIDIALAAIERIAGHRLVVIGSGPDEAWLRSQAGESTVFLGQIDDPERKLALVAGAVALIIPGEEDFGIVALEALACGVPVIAHRQSGAAEILEENRTGVFFDASSLDSLTAALERLLELRRLGTLRPEAGSALASNFSPERFEQAMYAQIAAIYERYCARQKLVSAP